MENKDKVILFNFLKLGLSTRDIDKKIGEDPSKTKGWVSW